ncbi:hypothetical protein Tco_0426173 [Tanacetum coccineum]
MGMLVRTAVGYDGNEDDVGWWLTMVVTTMLGWRRCKTLMVAVVVGGGIGVWVGLVVATMVGGDGGLVVCGGGGGCGWRFAAVVGRAGGGGCALS